MSGFKPPGGLSAGQEDAVDSIIDLPDNAVPKAMSGELVESSTVEDPTTREFMFSEAVVIPIDKEFKFSDAYKFTSTGATVSAEDQSTNTVNRIHFTDMALVVNPDIIVPRVDTGIFILQPIDADELTDPVDTPIVVPGIAPFLGFGEAESGQTVLFVDLKLTAASVKTNVMITIKLNGVVFAQSFFPTLTLFEAPNIYRFQYNPTWDVLVGDTIEVTTSSTDGPMIFLGRADTEQKWQRTNFILWDKKEVLIENENNTTVDNYARLNNDYTAVTGATSGIINSYLPTATTDTGSIFTDSSATSGGTGATCETTGSDTFAQGDIIQVSGGRLNNNFYEVEDHTGTVLEIRGNDGTATVEDWSLKDFNYDVVPATITKVNVSVMRSGVDGKWEQGKGSSTPLLFKVIDLFGSEYQFESDETESTTTSMTFVNKLTLTTPTVPAGDYRGEITCAITNDSSNKVVTIETVLDGNAVNESSFSPRNGGDFIVKTVFSNSTLVNGVHTLDLNFKAGSTGGTAKIKNARIEVFRVG